MRQSKLCKKCGEQKPLSEFYKGRLKCKSCFAKDSRNRYLENREYRLKKAAEYRDKHREELKQYFRDRYYGNKEALLEKQKEYVARHREEKKAYLRSYYRKNKKRLAAQNLERQRKRLAKDQMFKLKRQTRLLIWRSFNQRGCVKPACSRDILGCSLGFFTKYLKQTWLDKYGEEWNGQPCHIDHIRPLAKAKMRDDIIKLCHYTNLRLLTPEDNMKKGTHDTN